MLALLLALACTGGSPTQPPAPHDTATTVTSPTGTVPTTGQTGSTAATATTGHTGLGTAVTGTTAHTGGHTGQVTAHTGTSGTADTGFEVGPDFLPANATRTFRDEEQLHTLSVSQIARRLVLATSYIGPGIYEVDGLQNGIVSRKTSVWFPNDYGYKGYDDWPVSEDTRYLGDVTGDGVDDIAFAGTGLQTRAGPLSSFAPEWWSSRSFRCEGGTTPARHETWPCGDLNGDGVDELCITDGVAFGPVDEIPYCIQGSGLEPVPIPVNLTITRDGDRHIAAGDVDGDGQRELLVHQVSGADSAIHHLTDLSHGTSTLDDRAPAANGWSTTGVAYINPWDYLRDILLVGDLTGDGVDDVVLSTLDATYVGSWPPTDLATAPVATIPTTRSDDRNVRLADLDRDGHLDLIVGHELEQRVHIFRGPFSGTHSGVPDLVLGAENPLDSRFGALLDTGDLDGDGWPDLVVVDQWGGQGTGDSTWPKWNPRSAAKLYIYYSTTLFP